MINDFIISRPGREKLKCPPSIRPSVCPSQIIEKCPFAHFVVKFLEKQIFRGTFLSKNNKISFRVFFAFYAISNIFRKKCISGG